MRKRNISIYGSLVGGTFLLAFASAIVFLHVAVSASQNLHNKMFKKLLGATTYFFDTNPAGRCWSLVSPHGCPANAHMKSRKSFPLSAQRTVG